MLLADRAQVTRRGMTTSSCAPLPLWLGSPGGTAPSWAFLFLSSHPPLPCHMRRGMSLRTPWRVLRLEATRRTPRLRGHSVVLKYRATPMLPGRHGSREARTFSHTPVGPQASATPGCPGSKALASERPQPGPHARGRVLVSVSGSVALSLPPMALRLDRFAQRDPPAGPAPTRRPRFAPAQDEDSSFQWILAPRRQSSDSPKPRGEGVSRNSRKGIPGFLLPRLAANRDLPPSH